MNENFCILTKTAEAFHCCCCLLLVSLVFADVDILTLLPTAKCQKNNKPCLKNFELRIR